MSFQLLPDPENAWFVVEYAERVDEQQLVASRQAAAAANADGSFRDFILDFSGVRAFVLGADAVAEIAEIDRGRQEALPSGRCAIVAQRDLVEIGTTFLGTVSELDWTFSVFRSRAAAEAWLRGETDAPPLRRMR